jgi:ATP-dependent exoDNAse (exonuclease V) beta subunit
MSPPTDGRPPIADHAQRDAAIAERVRNVVIDAGAGTGKTTILVHRLVNMVAPMDGSRGVAIDRIAAITFTRRAAGELRLRIREELLRGLADGTTSPSRGEQLRAAFAGIDTAYIGTIHSFADRLLRLRPVEARLSPSYDVVEDDEPLIRETFVRLLHAVETDGLAEALAGTSAGMHAEAATQTVLDALRAGLRAESQELEYFTRHGLNGLVAEFVRRRDLPPPPSLGPAAFDGDTFRAVAAELDRMVAQLSGSSRGIRQLQWLAREVSRVLNAIDPISILLRLGPARKAIGDLKRGADFDGDKQSWEVLKDVRDGSARRVTPLLDDLLGPSQRWLAIRLANLFPVVIALYERVKVERKVIDQVDLLLKLRDLFVSDREARRYYQSLFDHLFVDEFQDTDPLQAEIILYLCEAGSRADDWRNIVLADGKLTVVGDPKQSIYRFRRADVAMYDDVRQLIGRGHPLSATLSVNFRSTNGLIDWFNARFPDLLGQASTGGQLFDRSSGEVFHQSLKGHRDNAAPAHVHVLPFEVAGEDLADNYRRLEAEVLARYLRWLVEVRKFLVFDPVVEEWRQVRYGDIAVLAVATLALDPLFPELDQLGVPYTARGGRLFLQDPLHWQFLLGLRALADVGDGIAHAALFRPPFFAVDLSDHVRARSPGAVVDGPLAVAREIVQELRRERFNRSPGTTARDLLERTAFARTIALGANGTQRLKRLRELCVQLEQIAAAEGLDYDAVTARLRTWVDDPIQLDPPSSPDADAVQIMTVHQAKGLEFPVVILWDGRALLRGQGEQSPWLVDRLGRGWSLALDRLAWDDPPDLNLRATEKQYGDAERKRVVYVAATRARDLLVLPKAGSPDSRHICGRLLANSPVNLVEELEVYREGGCPAWAAEVAESPPVDLGSAGEREPDIHDTWQPAAAEAAQARFRPVSVTGESLAATDEEEAGAGVYKRRKGRFGPVFGETVHRAIGIVLRDPAVAPPEAIRRTAKRTGLTAHLVEATEDVLRAVDVLRREGLIGNPERTVHTEYPVASASDRGTLIVGYIDLVSASDGQIDIIDFKTDEPPGDGIAVPPEYEAQVRTYEKLLAANASLGARVLRAGLFFTANGTCRWTYPLGWR